ncbi:hypothetical protein ACHAQA_004828 [Verticillium albo-atrum]
MHGQSYLSLALALAAPAAVGAVSGSGHSTRYWDCCKTSCAWEGKASSLMPPASVSAPVLTCDKNDNPLTDANAKSGCDGGGAFSCTNNSPFAINDDVAYGFAATAISGGSEASWCCACYALTFTTGPVAGKKMVVQSTNTGGDLGNNHFDIMMPGGGLGIFDGCSPQFGGIPGARYGGVGSRSECDGMPGLLKDGCQWRFDWFKNADNPDFTFEQVQCPSELVAISGCRRDDDGDFPAFNIIGSTPKPSPKPSTTKPAPAPVSTPTTKPEETKPDPKPETEQPKTSPAPVTEQPKPEQPEPVVEQPQQPEPVTEKPQPEKPVPVVSAVTTTTVAEAKPTLQPEEALPVTTTTAAAPSKGSSVPRVPIYGQCNSEKGWAKPKKCAKGLQCVWQNEWYSQCLPKHECS